MRKQFLFIFLALFLLQKTNAQTKGTKIGYIDMEYILQNVKDYNEAKSQLDQKAQKWKQDIELKKLEINKLKEELKAEKVLLTRELIAERESEIKFLETESLEYQQKIFGPFGFLVQQKSALAKPIQDQIFTAIQDIAEAKKYDFIFDKSSDLTMLFAAKRFDISDQILRVLNRTEKREELTAKQLKIQEAKENTEDAEENPALANRQKALEAKKAEREKLISDRKLAQEEKKKEVENNRKQLLFEKEAKKTGTVSVSSKIVSNDSIKLANKKLVEEARIKQTEEKAKVIADRKQVVEDTRKEVIQEREDKKAALILKSTKTGAAKSTSTEAVLVKVQLEEAKQKQAAERLKVIEDRKKELEANRLNLIKEREAKKEALKSKSVKIEEPKVEVVKDSVNKNLSPKPTEISSKEKIAAEHKAIIEERKKALEDKKKKILEEREALKKAREEKLKETINKN